MSVALLDPYRGFTFSYSHGDKSHDYDLISYGTSPSQQRDKLLSGPPFHSDSPQQQSFDSHQQTGLHNQADGHHEPESTFMDTHQMPSHYSYGIPPLQDNRKRRRSQSAVEGDEARGINRTLGPGIQQSMQPIPIEGQVSSPEASGFLYSMHSDNSTALPPSTHIFAPAISLPIPQQHHHHRLPSQALLHSDPHGFDSASSPLAIGPPSVVGQPGMPEPAPRPRGPKLKFTPDEDALLVELKEEKSLTWKQIADFFPGRTSGTLQVRYCTKLKAKDVNWTEDMVLRLQRALDEYEADRWRIVAGKVGNGYTPAACRERALQLGQSQLEQ
ncbi:uncharacterized protein N7459_008769 [Penicillium hispanicum]|uniref:uncharacterized protein n=1 Tax=Penicillium hispanicum TaxID=1080232 RepID=UPI002540F4D0|nr:uncharacterized protein N7459_008769 [Penicillium hispanicum]KAJ5574342.1 hypothetical protein N7459_008769 [Penicillium hispanicum]